MSLQTPKKAPNNHLLELIAKAVSPPKPNQVHSFPNYPHSFIGAAPQSLVTNVLDQYERTIPVWTSNKRTIQVPQKFLKALGIETPACRSELASDVLILAINWLNSEAKIDRSLVESETPNGFKHSRAVVDSLPDFIVECNNIMTYRALLQLKQLRNRHKLGSQGSTGNDKESESLQNLYIGLCCLLAFKINITQSREELLEKFSTTSEELNRVQDDMQLLQSDNWASISPVAETYLNVDASMETEGKASSGLINLELDDQFSGQGSVRMRPGKPLPKSNSLMSMNKENNSAPTSSSIGGGN